ncbi:MAG: peptidoglycan bridge formation protein FemAB, partial [Gemmatimonadetes bacterium]|nr:peptidoglycan bridge formation protein FemAB [Gemmatimonadota bacterium]
MGLTISPASLTDARWDGFLADRAEGTYAHLLGWGSVFKEAFGHAWQGLAAQEGDDLAGVLPLVRVKSVLFGDYLVSMPFINYGGPGGSDEARLARTDAARAMAAELGVGLL